MGKLVNAIVIVPVTQSAGKRYFRWSLTQSSTESLLQFFTVGFIVQLVVFSFVNQRLLPWFKLYVATELWLTLMGGESWNWWKDLEIVCVVIVIVRVSLFHFLISQKWLLKLSAAILSFSPVTEYASYNIGVFLCTQVVVLYLWLFHSHIFLQEISFHHNIVCWYSSELGSSYIQNKTLKTGQMGRLSSQAFRRGWKHCGQKKVWRACTTLL